MPFYTILTAIGKAKLANATALGDVVELTEIAVGDGGGVAITLNETDTALTNEVWRAALNGIDIDTDNANWIVAEGYIPSTSGGFTVREVALFDIDGDMIAIGNYPDTYKPTLASGSAKDLYIKVIIEVSNASTVTLKIDPAVILSTRKYVDEEAQKRALLGGSETQLFKVKDAVSDNEAVSLSQLKTMTGFKNQIINGEFAINQYANIDTLPVVASNTYFIDRNLLSSIGVSSTVQRIVNQLVGGRYVNTLKLVATSSANGTLGMAQIIEKHFKGETKTFGAFVKSNNANARLLIFDGVTFSSSNPHTGGGGWEFLTVTKQISVVASNLVCYAKITTAAGASVSIAIGDYIETTMWQLERGTVATPFEQRPIGLELSLCQRYYQDFSDSRSIVVSQYSSNNLSFFGNLFLKQEMRIAPSMTVSAYNPAGLTASSRLTPAGSWDFIYITPFSVVPRLTLTTTDTDLSAAVEIRGVTASAEL